MGRSTRAAHTFVVVVHVVMRVPLADDRAAAGVELHEADAAFHQSARQQTARAEVGAAFVVEAIRGAHRGRLTGEIDGLRGVRLHSEGQFIAGHAGRQLAVVGVEAGFVHGTQQVEGAPLPFGADVGRRLEVEDGVGALAQHRPLIDGGQEAGAQSSAPPSGVPSGCNNTQ